MGILRSGYEGWPKLSNLQFAWIHFHAKLISFIDVIKAFDSISSRDVQTFVLLGRKYLGLKPLFWGTDVSGTEMFSHHFNKDSSAHDRL